MEECKGTRYYSATELRTMINDYLSYWNDPFGKGDNDIAAANVLIKSALPIAQQLLVIVENIEKTGELILRAKCPSRFPGV